MAGSFMREGIEAEAWQEWEAKCHGRILPIETTASLAKKAAAIPSLCGTEATFVLRLCFRSTDSTSSMVDPLRKRGYILNPPQKLVEGFRQCTEAVAAFRFGPVRESY